MLRYLKLHQLLIKQHLKLLMAYKGDFLIGLLGVFLTQALNLVFLNVIFSQIPLLNGWNFKQITFIYGFSLIPKGLDHLFFDNLWAMGQRLVKKGEFDKYLIRPINPLFYVMVETFQVDALGELVVGVALLLSSFFMVSWTFWNVLLFFLTLPFTTLIYTSLKIMTASLALWTKQSGAAMYIFYMFNDFSKYPITIYNYPIRFLISVIIPFAFAAYYPASYFLTGNSLFQNIGGLILVSLGLYAIAYFIWKKGLLSYESAGS